MPKSPPSKPKDAQSRPVTVTPAVLRKWPLPQPNENGDKDDRGSVLIVGGALEVPGAIILAGTAALRAGAGKLQMATCRSIAQAVGIAVPEALVAALPESGAGEIDPSAAQEVARRANNVTATLIGPGMSGPDEASALIKDLLPQFKGGPLVLDAAALACVSGDPAALHALDGAVILTPHALEMAKMLDIDKEQVTHDPLAIVRRAAAELRAVVALKGSQTYIASPDGAVYWHKDGTVGLATSGSGDTLSGIIAGLLARGATPLQAIVWGVYLHAAAGNRLVTRTGRLGFIARELLAEIPPLMAKMAGSDKW